MVMAQTFNLSTQAAEASGSLEFKDSQGYTEKPYFKRPKKKNVSLTGLELAKYSRLAAQ